MKDRNFFMLLEVQDKECKESLAFAREGRYSVTMKVLGSEGCASSDDIKDLDNLLRRHTRHELPPLIDKICAPVVVDSAAIVDALNLFSN